MVSSTPNGTKPKFTNDSDNDLIFDNKMQAEDEKSRPERVAYHHQAEHRQCELALQ